MKLGDLYYVSQDGGDTKWRPMKLIGRGRFTYAWHELGSQEVLLWCVGDNSKEIYRHVNSLHIPPVNFVNTAQWNKEVDAYIFTMPFMDMVMARHTEAWRQMNLLNKLWRQHMDDIVRNRGMLYLLSIPNYGIAMADFHDVLDEAKLRLPTTLTDALHELIDRATDQGNFAFEFSKHNCSVTGEDDRLVLRDCLFNVEVLWDWNSRGINRPKPYRWPWEKM